jgi:hypothetical protein
MRLEALAGAASRRHVSIRSADASYHDQHSRLRAEETVYGAPTGFDNARLRLLNIV